ncbi:hypothetical protein [Streptomyces sp. WAC 01529]|uniref:hypothetical protein n=1 Tax=Streptomyces sp. WAC 01529 TaxID=2203205 RepID=UPI000F737513|nr:hypothetical protein [Streptomyces sp. WAC 01529]
MAIVRPVVACNRAHVGNGRVYLREMVFGDPTEPRHHQALVITARTEEAVAAALGRAGRLGESDAGARRVRRAVPLDGGKRERSRERRRDPA